MSKSTKNNTEVSSFVDFQPGGVGIANAEKIKGVFQTANLTPEILSSVDTAREQIMINVVTEAKNYAEKEFDQTGNEKTVVVDDINLGGQAVGTVVIGKDFKLVSSVVYHESSAMSAILSDCNSLYAAKNLANDPNETPELEDDGF